MLVKNFHSISQLWYWQHDRNWAPSPTKNMTVSSIKYLSGNIHIFYNLLKEFGIDVKTTANCWHLYVQLQFLIHEFGIDFKKASTNCHLYFQMFVIKGCAIGKPRLLQELDIDVMKTANRCHLILWSAIFAHNSC